MNTIKDCRDKLVPIMDAAIGLGNQVNHPLLPTKQIVTDLQLALSWLETANREYDKATAESIVVVEDNGPTPPEISRKAPTLISIPERFDYIYKNLEATSAEFYTFKEDQGFPPRVKAHLDHAYARITEAWFNTRTTELYYGQLTRQ
jgi:hypothetical protein